VTASHEEVVWRRAIRIEFLDSTAARRFGEKDHVKLVAGEIARHHGILRNCPRQLILGAQDHLDVYSRCFTESIPELRRQPGGAPRGGTEEEIPALEMRTNVF
jgi:hypothetical protein